MGFITWLAKLILGSENLERQMAEYVPGMQKGENPYLKMTPEERQEARRDVVNNIRALSGMGPLEQEARPVSGELAAQVQGLLPTASLSESSHNHSPTIQTDSQERYR